MYLALLNEKEKKLFLDFAQYVSASDGNVAAEEIEMLKEYCREMDISTEFEKPSQTIQNIIDGINSVCDTRSKRIIIFELVGLALSDNNYDVAEKQLLSEAIEVFGIDEKYLQECESLVSEYISFQNKVNHLILG